MKYSDMSNERKHAQPVQDAKQDSRRRRSDGPGNMEIQPRKKAVIVS